MLESTEENVRTEPDLVVGRVHRVELRLGPEVIAQLVLDYQAGVTTTELEQTYALNKVSVQRLLSEAGVEMRRQSLSTEQESQVVTLYESGLSIREVARQTGFPKTTVQDALSRLGVPKRPARRIKSS